MRNSPSASAHDACVRGLRHQGPRREVVAACLAVVATTCLPATPADVDPEPPPLNYAFASQLGDGIYEVDGRTVQMYRFQVRFAVPKATRGRWRLDVPVTACLGFFELDEDRVEAGADTTVSAWSVTPGVAATAEVRPGWSISPYVEIGVAREFSSSKPVYVYSAGLRSVVEFARRGLDFRVGNRGVYSTEDRSGAEYARDFAMLESGIEMRRPFDVHVRGRHVSIGLYALHYLYIEPTETYLNPDDPVRYGTRWEAGFTFGTEEPVRWRYGRLPRIGIGYCDGNGSPAVRLIIGQAF